MRRGFAIAVRIAGSVLATVVLAELASYLVIRLRRIPVELPSYSFAVLRGSFWADIDSAFGVWHRPNNSYRHRESCFDVTYHSNSYGARDKERLERPPNNEPRIVVLGDSFVEGYGVDAPARFTDRLEAISGMEHLNFGTGGHFGPLQEVLLYRTLARRFDHEGVIIGLLPANDFNDDDLEFGRRFHEDRYRPYLVGQYPEYRLEYYRSDALSRRTWFEGMAAAKRVARGFSITFNLVAYLRAARQYQAAGGRPAGAVAGPASGYFDFTEEQWDRMRFALQILAQDVGDKPLLIAVLPTEADIRRAESSGPSPLIERLRQLSRAEGFEVVDLLPAFARRSEGTPTLFHSCDGHWSPAGHELAASTMANVPFYDVIRAGGRVSRDRPRPIRWNDAGVR